MESSTAARRRFIPVVVRGGDPLFRFHHQHSMRRNSSAYVFCLGLFAVFVANRPAANDPATLLAPASERWIVTFADRPFDLEAYRQAVRTRQPATTVAARIAELEQQAIVHQAPFAATVQELGGRVLHHWWIINGCAVEVPPGAGTALRAHPGVRSVDRDAAPRPGVDHESRTAAAPVRSDHGVASAHALGVDGSGTALAILDTGQDADCGGSGRPHALYFGRHPANGLSGSRLVRNVQLGTLAGDDRVGHGTAVAAIAAGAAWPMEGSLPGHAPGAAIVGYGLAERDDGASSDATIISAWQQVARDRAEFGIVGANNSYCGSPDPRSAVQQALDSAAHNADLLVTVCAYNTGTLGTAHSQSACNGLAVGAVTTGDHVVCSYSARGPLHGDRARTYPDLCAVSGELGPSPDCEQSVVARAGTSFAAPQVLGAAALVRQAAPQASALETKAILLAATQELPQPADAADPNAGGCGLLRDDFAVATALDPARHRLLTLRRGEPARIVFPVIAGQRCSVAIAWHRTDVTAEHWADVDLRICSGDDVLAASCSRRNLWEHARFLPEHTGYCTAELVLRDSAEPNIEVAFAAAHAPAPARPGSYLPTDDDRGSRTIATTACIQHWNGNAAATDLRRDMPQLSSTEWVFECRVAATGTEIAGFELLAGLLSGAADVATGLYRDDGRGPAHEPVAVGTMHIGRASGWARTVFSNAVALQPDERFWLAVRGPAAARFLLLLAQGTPVQARCRWQCSGAFVAAGAAPVGLRMLGADAGPPTMLLDAAAPPTVGAAFACRLHPVPPATPVVLTTWVPTATWPLSLPALGLLPVIPGLVLGTTADAHGGAALVAPMPTAPWLAGAAFEQMAVALSDPASSPPHAVARAVGQLGSRR